MVNLWDATSTTDESDSDSAPPAIASPKKRTRADTELSDDVDILPEAKRKLIQSQAAWQAVQRAVRKREDIGLQEDAEKSEDEAEIVSKPSARDTHDAELSDFDDYLAAPGRHSPTAAALDHNVTANFSKNRLKLQQLAQLDNADSESQEYIPSESPQPVAVVRTAAATGRLAAPTALEASADDGSHASEGDLDADSGEGKVVIIVQTKQGQKSTFRVAKSSCLSGVFDHFREAQKSLLAGKQPSFWFDGDKVVGSATPESLDMDEESTIDVTW
ncbi:hypothetical protein WJX73_002486 [Symbiochloris irregularis]|uniref:Rad60/SUMO-like domain-containing protein n=1 Tax=Symbiochloris irregularis TaxID=706552 RepID=A0AAW1PBY0_9CHLO